MKALSFFSLLLCTAGLANLGHAADPAQTAPCPAKFVLPDPVAVVEGKEIKAADVQKVLASLMERSGKRDADVSNDQKMRVARQIVKSMIQEQLVKNRAVDVKIDDAQVDARYQQIAARPNFEEMLKANNMTADSVKEKIRESAREQKWMESQIKATPPTDAEIKAFFDSHASAFDVPETVRTSHIFIKVPEGAKPEVVAEKQKAIDAAAARIGKGEDFAKVASEVSEDAGSKAKGGDLNYLPRQKMPPEYADAAFALKTDEVSKVVKTQAGFHIIKSAGHKDAHKTSLDEAKPQIVAYLGQQKDRELTTKLLKEIEAKADIKNNLPPDTEPIPFAPSLVTPQTDSPKSAKPGN